MKNIKSSLLFISIFFIGEVVAQETQITSDICITPSISLKLIETEYWVGKLELALDQSRNYWIVKRLMLMNGLNYIYKWL